MFAQALVKFCHFYGKKLSVEKVYQENGISDETLINSLIEK